jgi:hypothetical protein
VPQVPAEWASPGKRRAKAGGNGGSDHAAALASLRGDGDPATAALVTQLEEALKCARDRRNGDKPIPQRMSELEKRRAHKVQTAKKADDLVADLEEKMEALVGRLHDAKSEAKERKDELLGIDKLVEECKSSALARAGTVSVDTGGCEVPAASSIVSSLFSPEVGSLLMADPSTQALLVASNDALLTLASQLREAAVRLAASDDTRVSVEVPSVPSPAVARPRWSDGVPEDDDGDMDDDDEKKVLACLWPDADGASGDPKMSINKKLADSGFMLVAKKRRGGPYG